jgi:hypothetical protein
MVVAWSAGAHAADSEECELALQRLVVLLEQRGELQLSADSSRLPSPESDYSECVVPPGAEAIFKANAYAVLRAPDDITVFVRKTELATGTRVVLGPFFSAYRK